MKLCSFVILKSTSPQTLKHQIYMRLNFDHNFMDSTWNSHNSNSYFNRLDY